MRQMLIRTYAFASEKQSLSANHDEAMPLHMTSC